MLQNVGRGVERWALMSALLLGGCQLIIGEIELPPERPVDAMADAATDASDAATDASDAATDASDAATDASDAATDASDAVTDASDAVTDASDAASDGDVAPTDAVVDALPIDATPPPEAIYEGVWHVYGVRGPSADQGTRAMILGRLDVDIRGDGIYTEGLGAAAEGPSKALQLEGSTLRLNLFERTFVGVVDPGTGVGLLMREEANEGAEYLLLLVRAQTTKFPKNSRYTHAWVSARSGAMQHGTRDKEREANTYTEHETLQLVSDPAPDAVLLSSEALGDGRTRFRGDGSETTRLLTPLGTGGLLSREYGALGIVELQGHDGLSPAGLGMAWGAEVALPIENKDFFCGGISAPEGTLEFHAETLNVRNGQLSWGGHIGTTSGHGGHLRLQGVFPLLGFTEMIVFVDPSERLMVLHPMLFSGEAEPLPLALEWGFGVCVHLWNEPS